MRAEEEAAQSNVSPGDLQTATSTAAALPEPTRQPELLFELPAISDTINYELDKDPFDFGVVAHQAFEDAEDVRENLREIEVFLKSTVAAEGDLSVISAGGKSRDSSQQ